MRKHLKTFLMTSAGLAAFWAPLAAEDIVPLRENGRTVYVNGGLPSNSHSDRALAPRRASVLVYWSRSEHRWKRVPPPSPTALRAARSAAAEVTTAVAALPPLASPHTTSAPGRQLAADTRDQTVDTAIEEAATRHGVDPNLVRAIIQVESNFNPQARSQKGAMGLMQLMPHTARSLHVRNPWDPQQNIDAGVRHLKGLLEGFGGNLKLSLAAYNAGTAAVQRSNGVPPYRETRNYVRQITELYGSGMAGNGPAPIHRSRDAQGHLRFSNTD